MKRDSLDVQDEVQAHYNKLVDLGYNVVGVFLYGSQNYELDYEGSDVDTKAIVLPTLEDIILNRPLVSTTVDMGNGCQCDVKDIRKMFECFKKQNINFVELLFTKYYVLNPEYAELYQPMLDSAEKIARYNNYASVNCMAGMAFEKLAALTHPYPSIKEKIDKYHYDPKQLHHILRLKDFIARYCDGEEYKSILIPSDKEHLLAVKKDVIYNVDEAVELANNTVQWIKQFKDEYMKKNPVHIDEDVDRLMSQVMTDLIALSVKKEVNQ